MATIYKQHFISEISKSMFEHHLGRALPLQLPWQPNNNKDDIIGYILTDD